jgi:hypothetical protein
MFLFMFKFTPRKLAPLSHVGTVHCNKPPQLSADLNTEAESVFIAVFAAYDKVDNRTKFAK